MTASDYYVKLFEELVKMEPNKTTEELEFDALCEQYEKRFGRGVGYSIGDYAPASIEEAIEEIRECLRTGVPLKIEQWNPENHFNP